MSTDAMPADPQDAVIRWLAAPATHGGAAVRRIDTHGAVVVLAGDRAWKLKRAVRCPSMDFSTLDRRREACRGEVALNARLAPSLYLGAVPVVAGADGGLRFGTEAEADAAVEWVVAMRRFDEAGLFDRLATERRLEVAHVRDLATAVAAFHRAADPRPGAGGPEAVAWVLDDNTAEMAAMPDRLDPARVALLAARSRAAFADLRDLIASRSRSGRVRACHGDLHLRNVCLVDGRPTPFDGIEFNAALTDIDVWYDVAFLLMDLDHRGLRTLANVALNAYVEAGGDLDGIALLPLFLSMRAAVRAKVVATAAGGAGDPAAAVRLTAEARAYLDRALACVEPAPPRLVAIGGLSGTGKTTVARAVAPGLGRTPGAVILRTDRIRKDRAGVAETARLPPDAYGPGTAERVYAAQAAAAARVLAAGQAVVADGVHARPADRKAIAAVAAAAGVPFQGIWLETDAATALARVAARRGDASDADAAVVRLQASFDLGPMGWTRIAADGNPDAVAARVLDALARH
ncbi:MAG: AAA family ATPase [Rhodospirillales bacterium]